ncbi:hypothetical protein F5X96DRAFT_619206 [Biscogniauxia mediterranea]|nr:hypothetical protein F5X96DRAFT_619206 [Biscogniauxia mediterranea]
MHTYLAGLCCLSMPLNASQGVLRSPKACRCKKREIENPSLSLERVKMSRGISKRLIQEWQETAYRHTYPIHG